MDYISLILPLNNLSVSKEKATTENWLYFSQGKAIKLRTNSQNATTTQKNPSQVSKVQAILQWSFILPACYNHLGNFWSWPRESDCVGVGRVFLPKVLGWFSKCSQEWGQGDSACAAPALQHRQHCLSLNESTVLHGSSIKKNLTEVFSLPSFLLPTPAVMCPILTITRLTS